MRNYLGRASQKENLQSGSGSSMSGAVLYRKKVLDFFAKTDGILFA